MSNDLTTEERRWADSAGKALRESETHVDAVTAARLRAARARALERVASAPSWTWVAPAMPGLPWLGGIGAGATLGIALLAWALLPRTAAVPEVAVNLAGVNALELLTDEQGPEFYQDLDLYLWLEESGEVVDGRA